MVAIIVWGAAAWFFGIPTSQSHSLIAGLTGAAIALQGSFDAINGAEWMKVVYGILLVYAAGLLLGVGELQAAWPLSVRDAGPAAGIAGSSAGRRSPRALRRVAFMHGAQDGQKFMSIFVLAIALAMGHGAGRRRWRCPSG